jgi:predicted metalloprotease with PDZ domain
MCVLLVNAKSVLRRRKLFTVIVKEFLVNADKSGKDYFPIYLMKFLFYAAFLALLTLGARAQMPTTPPPDDKDKPKPFAPVLVSQHQGAGRIGVRLVFEKDGTCLIGGLVRGGPAYDVGFRVGDTVIKIDKNLVSSLTPNEARLALHGRPGTGVELTVMRDDNPRYIVRAAERRVLPNEVEEMSQPPVSESAAEPGPIAEPASAK